MVRNLINGQLMEKGFQIPFSYYQHHQCYMKLTDHNRYVKTNFKTCQTVSFMNWFYFCSLWVIF